MRERTHEKYDRLIAKAETLPALATAVAHPCDESSLSGALDAMEAKLITPILVGPIARITGTAKQLGRSLDGIEIVDTPHSHAAAAKAVEIVRSGRA